MSKNIDLDVFENREDDWLAKQRQHEARVSAWDFDEGRRLKIEHEIKHNEFNQKREVIRELSRERNNEFQNLNTTKLNSSNSDPKPLIITIVIATIFIMAIGFITNFNMDNFAGSFIIYFMLMIFLANKKRRK